MRRQKRKRRRLRKWAKGAVLCFACFAIYQTSSFLKEHFWEKASVLHAEKPQEESVYSQFVGSRNQIVYYNQEDPRWGEQNYGPVDKIKDAGCGPTVLAMAVSSLTENQIDPEGMCRWAYVNGYCSVGSGSYHTLIAEGLETFGIGTTVTNSRSEVERALKNKKLVIALMGEGHFTSGGHFILLFEMDEQDRVTVADPTSLERTEKKWDLDIIAEEAKLSPAAGGAFWILESEGDVEKHLLFCRPFLFFHSAKTTGFALPCFYNQRHGGKIWNQRFT